ncbi:MAG: flagellar protein FliT, partial [Methyloversatilis sp. 12-65-5]
KVALMKQILAHDAEVRRHVEPWMAQVKVFLGKLPAGRAENG